MTTRAEPHSVDIGIVVALKDEVRELLELAGEYEPRNDGSLNSYLFTYASYRCVATLVGPMGESEATRITERQITIFDPAAVVVVGISGSVHNDLRVGDAYVPSQAVQYIQDARAAPTESGGFHIAPGPPAIRPDYDLYTKASGFDLNHPALYRRWREECRRDLEAQLPTASVRERLFTEDLVRREIEFIATGHEASGPVVSAAAAFSAWIRTFDRNVKAIDMETAAVLTTAQSRQNAKPAIAIRGISDYGDDRKAKLDAIGGGALRKCAMRNAVRFLWAMLQAKVLPQQPSASRPPSKSPETGSPSSVQVPVQSIRSTAPVSAPEPEVRVNQHTVGRHGASHSVSFHGPVHGQVAVGDYNIQHQTILSGPTPRELTADDLTTMADRLSRFRGLGVNIFSYNSGGREAVNFARQLASLLKAAGWAVTSVSGSEQGEPRSDRPVPGLLVEVGPQRGVPEQHEAATALVEDLRSRRITTGGPIPFNAWARGGIMVQGTEDPGAAVQVTIGPVY
jgi:nucleoside phosphorylase